MDKAQSYINLEELAGGAFAEKLNDALAQVAENIQNPNTSAVAKRQITVNIKFAPNKTRQMVNTQIAVTTKLAATEAIDTQMLMGVNPRNGKVEFSEYTGQIMGQMRIDDIPQPEEEPEQAEPQQATGKPLDLRNRGKKAEPAPEELIPGVDCDPYTGELYETRRTDSRVVNINEKAAQA